METETIPPETPDETTPTPETTPEPVEHDDGNEGGRQQPAPGERKVGEPVEP
jgi:hypothetical protein